MFDDLEEFDIDGRNSSGVHWSLYYNHDALDNFNHTPSVTATKPPAATYVFSSLEELLNSPEVQDLIKKTVACKQQQIDILQNELWRAYERISRAKMALK